MHESFPNTRGVRALIAALALVGLAACGERIHSKQVRASDQAKPDASAVVIGQAPAPPTGDPPGTTPVSPGTTEVTKQVETEAKPQEGDNHSYSTIAPETPQKAQGKNTADERSTQ